MPARRKKGARKKGARRPSTAPAHTPKKRPRRAGSIAERRAAAGNGADHTPPVVAPTPIPPPLPSSPQAPQLQVDKDFLLHLGRLFIDASAKYVPILAQAVQTTRKAVSYGVAVRFQRDPDLGVIAVGIQVHEPMLPSEGMPSSDLVLDRIDQGQVQMLFDGDMASFMEALEQSDDVMGAEKPGGESFDDEDPYEPEENTYSDADDPTPRG